MRRRAEAEIIFPMQQAHTWVALLHDSAPYCNAAKFNIQYRFIETA